MVKCFTNIWKCLCAVLFLGDCIAFSYVLKSFPSMMLVVHLYSSAVHSYLPLQFLYVVLTTFSYSMFTNRERENWHLPIIFILLLWSWGTLSLHFANLSNSFSVLFHEFSVHRELHCPMMFIYSAIFEWYFGRAHRQWEHFWKVNFWTTVKVYKYYYCLRQNARIWWIVWRLYVSIHHKITFQ